MTAFWSSDGRYRTNARCFLKAVCLKLCSDGEVSIGAYGGLEFKCADVIVPRWQYLTDKAATLQGR